jgi:hypothetical protein
VIGVDCFCAGLILFIFLSAVAFLTIEAAEAAEEKIALFNRLPSYFNPAPITPESILISNHLTPPFGNLHFQIGMD